MLGPVLDRITNETLALVVLIGALVFVTAEKLWRLSFRVTVKKTEDNILRTIGLTTSALKDLDANSAAARRLSRFLQEELLEDLETKRKQIKTRRSKLNKNGPFALAISTLPFLVLAPPFTLEAIFYVTELELTPFPASLFYFCLAILYLVLFLVLFGILMLYLALVDFTGHKIEAIWERFKTRRVKKRTHLDSDSMEDVHHST